MLVRKGLFKNKHHMQHVPTIFQASIHMFWQPREMDFIHRDQFRHEKIKRRVTWSTARMQLVPGTRFKSWESKSALTFCEWFGLTLHSLPSPNFTPYVNCFAHNHSTTVIKCESWSSDIRGFVFLLLCIPFPLLGSEAPPSLKQTLPTLS